MCVVNYKQFESRRLIHKEQIRNIKDRLIKQRVVRNITQLEISKLIGTTPSAISRFERKGYEHKTSLKFFSRYANAIGMSLTVSISDCDDLQKDER